VAGFAAATYLRGLPFALAPTTLLAQVDAGVGGKTGVNFRGRKNQIGVFRQPRLVWCDPAMLGTLPPRETLNGLAEAIKHAAIADPALFAFLEQNVEPLLALDADVLARVVQDCLRIKLDFVRRDELEDFGPRRMLNFGHTLGHAIEAATGQPHGFAVAWGMAAAARLSVARGLLPAADAARLDGLLRRFGYPPPPALDRERALAAARDDKKRHGDELRFVLLTRLGEAAVVEMGLAELAAAWDILWGT
jgi:3-dehydroquinate synthase